METRRGFVRLFSIRERGDNSETRLPPCSSAPQSGVPQSRPLNKQIGGRAGQVPAGRLRTLSPAERNTIYVCVCVRVCSCPRVHVFCACFVLFVYLFVLSVCASRWKADDLCLRKSHSAPVVSWSRITAVLLQLVHFARPPGRHPKSALRMWARRSGIFWHGKGCLLTVSQLRD